MTALTYDSEHVARGVERLIERYRRPRTSALLESWLAEVQEVEDALWQLLVERSLESAEGAQLDVLGRIVGEPRRGRDDDTYRVWIEARNLVSRSSGTTTQMLALVRKLLPTIGFSFEEYYPAAFVVRFGPGLDLDAGYQVAYMLRQAKAAGVLFEMTWPIDGAGGVFAFSPDDAPVPDSPIGFDAGVWAVVADGSFIPLGGDEEVTGGGLVIQGVPITIGGAHIVVTPRAALAVPATAPAAAPIIAPARIVPRTAAALVPAPVPAAGETRELEDTFGDASLEMTEGGTHFRVAGLLQTAIHAMRFVFPLRTQSVAGTSFEEIGILRFDAASWEGAGTILLVAELEVSKPSQVAELQLFDLTAGAPVGEPLTASTTTATKCMAGVALSPGERLYSVRLRRVGGSADERVSCRSAAFEVSYA